MCLFVADPFDVICLRTKIICIIYIAHSAFPCTVAY